MSGLNLYVALVHYPVLNKKGDTICSAVTNLDIHDIARLSRTYGVRKYYIVTTLEDQDELTRQVITHWRDGEGGKKNPARKEAFSIVRVVSSVAEAVADIQKENRNPVNIIATTARMADSAVSYPEMKTIMTNSSDNFLLTFGTAWGLTREFVDQATYTLQPLAGMGDYNHLSVRSAASIIVDRLAAR